MKYENLAAIWAYGSNCVQQKNFMWAIGFFVCTYLLSWSESIWAFIREFPINFEYPKIEVNLFIKIDWNHWAHISKWIYEVHYLHTNSWHHFTSNNFNFRKLKYFVRIFSDFRIVTYQHARTSKSMSFSEMLASSVIFGKGREAQIMSNYL